MSKGNRKLKLKLYYNNPHCYYCGRRTVLTNISNRGLPSNAATVEHLVSRFHKDWKEKKNIVVLSCNECNQKRCELETLSLSRDEIVKRSKGFSIISPKK